MKKQTRYQSLLESISQTLVGLAITSRGFTQLREFKTQTK